MSKKGRKDIADWLRRQAGFLERSGSLLSKRFTARYIYTSAIIVLLAFAVAGTAQTNVPPIPSVTPVADAATSSTFKPILDLLGGSGTWITTVIAWFAAVSALLAPFAVWIRNKLANAINSAAESSGEDDDTYLRALFSAGWYRFLAFVLNFANVRFPTLAELERAIALQKEAVREAKSNTVGGG